MVSIDQWAEDHGIHIGYCRRHRIKVDETCDRCEDANANTNWVTACCDARPVGEIEFDGVDGADANMVAVSYATCGECGKFSSVALTGGWNELR